MIRALPICLLLCGCGLLDQTVRVSSLIPPGDSIRVPSMVWTEPEAEMVLAKPPPLCMWNIQCEFATGDVNQDGVWDRWDVQLFIYEWNDGIRIDRNGDGCPESDNDDNGFCEECDWIRFEELWKRGI